MNNELLFEYGFESINGIVKKQYFLNEIPNIKEKCDVWNELPLVYVRQYTGKEDRNGNNIFEGDKLRVYGGLEYIVKFIGFEWCISNGNICYGFDQLKSEITEIIGNIHENQDA